jgi:hypothetical protein
MDSGPAWKGTGSLPRQAVAEADDLGRGDRGRDLSVTELVAFSVALGRSVQDLLSPRRWDQRVKLPGGQIEGSALVIGALDPSTTPIVAEIARLLRKRIRDLELMAEGLGADVSVLERLREAQGVGRIRGSRLRQRRA